MLDLNYVRENLEKVRAAESPLNTKKLSEAVARYLFKLMAYKDEYEVARLHSDPGFLNSVAAQFEGDYKLNYHLAPPLTAKKNAKGELQKSQFGPFMLTGFKVEPIPFVGDWLDAKLPQFVTQGMNSSVQSVFAGIDPATSDEYRAFLDFPLGGHDGVPGDAFIESAFLDIFASNLQPNSGSLPLRIELVAFQPPTLFPTDFDLTLQPALAYIQVSSEINGSDVGSNISIDVTPLMIRAQQLGLVDFQVRVLEDLGPPIPVLLEINDTTGSSRSSFAPLLTVTYH